MIKRKKLCCFDIDGTLIKSDTPSTEGVQYALSEGFNCQFQNIEVPKHVGTAMGLAREFLQANNITKQTYADYDEKIKKSEEVFNSYLEKGINDKRFSWRPLPHAPELLEKLSNHNDVKLALLSANPRRVAEMKLLSAKIDIKLFMEDSQLIGAFGCENEDRSELVRILWSRYCNISRLENQELDPNAMVIVGDTPNDIKCAHDNNVPCVAVATGDFLPHALQEADYVLENFNNVERTVEILLQASR